MRVQAALVVALSFLFTALAGCVTIPDERVGAQNVPGALPGGAQARALSLAGDGSMSAAMPPASRVALEWGWLQWFDGVLAPAWYAEPATAPYVVTEATARVLYDAMHPVTSPKQRPEFTVWFGVEDSIVDHGFQDGPDVLLPGGTLAVFELGLPRGGLVVEKGERLVLRIGSYYDDDDRQGGVAVRFGSSEGTRLDLVTQLLVSAPRMVSSMGLEGSVSLIGGRCMGFDDLSDADLVWVPFVPDTKLGPLVGLDVVVDRTTGNGPPDVDFVLLDAAGEVAGHAAGSAGHEALRLRTPNLALAVIDGEWQLGVYACTLQQGEATYSVVMHHGGS